MIRIGLLTAVAIAAARQPPAQPASFLRSAAFLSFIVAFGPAVPAIASEDRIPEPGLRYHVTDVRQGDQLNVREFPGTDANIIDTLDPATGNIIVSGTRQMLGIGTWWELILPNDQRTYGWVNARFLELETGGASEEVDYPLVCDGTEPFWSVFTDRNQARYSLGAEDAQTFQASSWINASGFRPGYNFVIRLLGAEGQGSLVVLNASDYCSDNMSDRLYRFHATLILPKGDVYSGCCSRSAR